jgi:hypothetical protein
VVFLPISQFQKADDLEMAFAVAPGVAGPNDVNFYLRDVNGDDRPYTLLTARFSYLDTRITGEELRPVQLHEVPLAHRPDRARLCRALAGRGRGQPRPPGGHALHVRVAAPPSLNRKHEGVITCFALGLSR